MKKQKRIQELLAQIKQWNDGDEDSFIRFGEVPFDTRSVLIARRKVINELEKLLK